ncbi:inovirus-type Gp2 protein [Pseudomonas chlororaphis]|uniref:inovirus-type Gp2 protein n=1 Tax=Pseudomonas chlororaphis TaxID=587753 RepID=UPI002365B552|nr:inovirus-type Gp2 protein [Pseudomonas chlororaphis]WDH23690.1 inovirus-type Gp2 protein [Pseudomonas chlororaphis]
MTNRKTYTHLSQSDITLQIERLVQAIEDSDSPAYRIKQARTGYERVEDTKLSRYFTHIKQMYDLFDDRVPYDYSEHLQAFWEACQDIGLERNPDGPACLNERGTAWLDHHRSMNALVARIRQFTCERWYLRRKDDLRHQAIKQGIQACDYVDALWDLYSRITIVRVDLHYRSEAQARLRVEHVFEDMKQLIAQHRRNPIFDHLIGHMYSVEQGDRNDGGGYHIHAAYFFNGNEVRGDVFKAIKLGELWEDITHGQGYMYSCNHDKDQYGDECGIGRIERSDRAIRRHVHKVVKYLVKDAQHLRLRPEGARCLRTGQLKRPRRG